MFHDRDDQPGCEKPEAADDHSPRHKEVSKLELTVVEKIIDSHRLQLSQAVRLLASRGIRSGLAPEDIFQRMFIEDIRLDASDFARVVELDAHVIIERADRRSAG